MKPRLTEDPVAALRSAAVPLRGEATDFDPLIESMGESRLVLLGEATHGTHEFYRARAEVTKRLIVEKGFNIVAWEADWPDALRVNRFVRGNGNDRSAFQALGSFQRFPTWMWRNRDVLELVRWVSVHNERLEPSLKAGIYGLDLYSLHSSMNAVIAYLEKTDPAAARRARERYACFEHFGEDPQTYGLVATQHESLSCEQAVLEQLRELQRRNAEAEDGDEPFFAEQNARVAKNAELYYRAMFYGRPNTWNLRDTHMADTLDALLEHVKEQGREAKAVVWAHNSHVGDARSTAMGRRGELNVGQLARERHPGETFIVGFTTHSGTVMAANDWGEEPRVKTVRPALDGSIEALLHEVRVPAFLLDLRAQRAAAHALKRERLERAIGVVYRPATERWSHYFEASVAEQFDAVMHYDETRAVESLPTREPDRPDDLPETYPHGL
jgi:erythromycin esterase-like protein